MAICKRCNANEATPGSVNWLLFLPLLAILPPPSPDTFCKDCGGGLNFLGFMITAALLVIAFVVAVILW